MSLHRVPVTSLARRASPNFAQLRSISPHSRPHLLARAHPAPIAGGTRRPSNGQGRVEGRVGFWVERCRCQLPAPPRIRDDASTARKKQLTLIARRVCPSGGRGPTAPGCARVSAYSVAQVGRGLRYGSRFLELEGRTSAHGSGGLLDWGRVKTRATLQPARARSAERGDLGVGARSTSCPCAGRGGRGGEAKHTREAHGSFVQHAV